MKAKNTYNILNESILLEDIPQSFISAIMTHSTSLGNNPAIPDVYNELFLLKVVKERFSDIKNELKSIGSITDVKSNKLDNALSELIFKCKNIEKLYRPQLETLCYNIIVDLFGIPEDSVDLDLKLVDKINVANKNILIDPIYDNDYELDNIKTVNNTKNEVYKRKLLNCLCMGGAMDISSDISLYSNEIAKIDPNLIQMYEEITLLNNYLLFENENINIKDNDEKQMGLVTVSLCQQNERVKISVEAEIFPVLLCEAIKGFFELFTSHGLPKNIKIAQLVLNQTDYIKTDPWNMRLGIPLWKTFLSSIHNISSLELPYFLKRISSLNIERFNLLMNEVFAKTKKGKKIMNIIYQKSKDDVEYDNFVDKMTKLKNNKNIINDDFIHPEEL